VRFLFRFFIGCCFVALGRGAVATDVGGFGSRFSDLSVAHRTGAAIHSLVGEGPAAKAGLIEGDTIRLINGHLVSNAATAYRAIAKLPAGTTVDVWYERDGKLRVVNATLWKRRLDAEVATIYVFHEAQKWAENRDAAYVFRINDRRFALKDRQYCMVEVPSGRARITCEPFGGGFILDINPGQIMYFRSTFGQQYDLHRGFIGVARKEKAAGFLKRAEPGKELKALRDAR
jgi:hypothetical protein